MCLTLSCASSGKLHSNWKALCASAQQQAPSVRAQAHKPDTQLHAKPRALAAAVTTHSKACAAENLTSCLHHFTGNGHSGVDRVGDDLNDCLQAGTRRPARQHMLRTSCIC